MPGLGSVLLEFAAGSAAEFHQGVGLDHHPPAGGERRFEHSRGLQFRHLPCVAFQRAHDREVERAVECGKSQLVRGVHAESDP